MNAFLFVIGWVLAHGPVEDYQQKGILTDLSILKQLNLPIVLQDEEINVGFTYINPEQEAQISAVSHALGRCAGFGALPAIESTSEKSTENIAREELQKVRQAYFQEQSALYLKQSLNLKYNAKIAEAMSEVSEANLEATVRWLSESFPTRFHRADTNNAHVLALKERLEKMLETSGLPHQIDLITHRSTPQYSLRLRLVGSEAPREIVVLGGHLDSIVQWSTRGIAPGADDNASGSSNLIETLRILSTKGQPKRSVDFFWYAGEEAGLLGSGEIAKTYKQEQQNVIAVLQLDMTLQPGAGEMVIGNATDFTSLWLREFLVELNRLYLNITLREFQCGYGCSDHASWFKEGYATLMPFEATMQTINRRIHTVNDVINADSSFKHSAVFSKIALGFAMELANP